MAKLPDMVDGMAVDKDHLKIKMNEKELFSDCIAGKMTRDTPGTRRRVPRRRVRF